LFRLIFLVVLMAAPLAGEAAAARTAAYQPDRLNGERVNQLVAGPGNLLGEGNVEGAVAAFDRLLASATAAHGAQSLEAADLLTAFGVVMAGQADVHPGLDLRRRALDYLERSIPIYRRVFGRGHPEVAVALNSWADVERARRPHWPGPAEAALAEALRIRQASLGPRHRETLWTIIYLSDVRGRFALTGGVMTRAEPVAADLERAIALSAGSDAETARAYPVVANLRLARLLARHGQASRAIRAIEAAAAAERRHPDYGQCTQIVGTAEEVAALVAGRPAGGKAERLDSLISGNAACLGEQPKLDLDEVLVDAELQALEDAAGALDEPVDEPAEIPPSQGDGDGL